MKLLKNSFDKKFDLCIWGLGYESRSTFLMKKTTEIATNEIAIGYREHTECFFYKENKNDYLERRINVIEPTDNELDNYLSSELFLSIVKSSKNILLDITVMTRIRLSKIIISLIENIDSLSNLTISYSPSEFVPPPNEFTPINAMGPLHKRVFGTIGDLSKPSALILGIGYEKGKALGVYNHLECQENFILQPKSCIKNFDAPIEKNNRELLGNIDRTNIFVYEVEKPLLTYILLRDIIKHCLVNYRPILVPLGPKILTAVGVIIAVDASPNLPVWRVSSEHCEVPTDRAANGKIVSFTVTKTVS